MVFVLLDSSVLLFVSPLKLNIKQRCSIIKLGKNLINRSHPRNPKHDVCSVRRLALEVDPEFGDVYPMHIQSAARQSDQILQRGSGREPTAVSSHDFVYYHHARIRGRLGTHIFEEFGPLLGGGPRPQTLRDGIYIIIDSLGQADDRQIVLLARKECGQVRRGRIGIIPPYGVR